MSSPLLPITMGEQIAMIDGCEFVGVSDTGEVFVSWHDIDPASKEDAIKLISDWPEVTAVTEVFSVSRKEVQALVNGLNQLMEETEEPGDVHRLLDSNSGISSEEREAFERILAGYNNHPGCPGSSCPAGDQSESSQVREKGCGKSPSGDGCGGCRH